MELAKGNKGGIAEVLEGSEQVHWSHHVAAAALVAGAVLLVCGRQRRALAIAAAGAVATIFERPQQAQELWTRLPDHIRTGQDFLVRAEAFIEKLAEQSARIRETISRQA